MAEQAARRAPNPIKGEAPFGKTGLVLVFDFNTMCLLEAATDLKADELLACLENDMGATLARAFVWAGLQEHQPEITIEQAGAWIGEVGIAETTRSLTIALAAAFATPEGKKGSDPTKQKVPRKR